MVKVVVCCSKIVQKVCLFGCLLHPYKYFDAAASTPAQQAEEHLSGFVFHRENVLREEETCKGNVHIHFKLKLFESCIYAIFSGLF